MRSMYDLNRQSEVALKAIHFMDLKQKKFVKIKFLDEKTAFIHSKKKKKMPLNEIQIALKYIRWKETNILFPKKLKSLNKKY